MSKQVGPYYCMNPVLLCTRDIAFFGPLIPATTKVYNHFLLLKTSREAPCKSFQSSLSSLVRPLSLITRLPFRTYNDGQKSHKIVHFFSRLNF